MLNAGVMMTPYSTTTDGYEIQFGTNYLGHFYMVHSLLDNMDTINGRIVHIGSAAHEHYMYPNGVEFDQLNNDKNYDKRLCSVGIEILVVSCSVTF